MIAIDAIKTVVDLAESHIPMVILHGLSVEVHRFPFLPQRSIIPLALIGMVVVVAVTVLMGESVIVFPPQILIISSHCFQRLLVLWVHVQCARIHKFGMTNQQLITPIVPGMTT